MEIANVQARQTCDARKLPLLAFATLLTYTLRTLLAIYFFYLPKIVLKWALFSYCCLEISLILLSLQAKFVAGLRHIELMDLLLVGRDLDQLSLGYFFLPHVVEEAARAAATIFGLTLCRR